MNISTLGTIFVFNCFSKIVKVFQRVTIYVIVVMSFEVSSRQALKTFRIDELIIDDEYFNAWYNFRFAIASNASKEVSSVNGDSKKGGQA